MSDNPWDVFPNDEESAQRIAEWLLIESVEDLRDRTRADASRYDVLGISAVLRRTLSDRRPVLALSRARLKARAPQFSFTAWSGQVAEPPPGGLMRVFDSADNFDTPTVTTDLDGFLSAEAGRFFRDPVTVRTLIRCFAHAYGGVHLGTPENEFERMAQRLVASHELLTRGWETTLKQIAVVAADALTPLAELLRANPAPSLLDLPEA